MQAWHYDDILYRVITEESHRVEYALWYHRLRTAICNRSPEYYTKQFKDGCYPDCVFDPTSADKWTNKGRQLREAKEFNIAFCKSHLADSRHPIARPANVKSNVARMKEQKGSEHFRFLGNDFDMEPLLPTVDSTGVLNDLVKRCLVGPLRHVPVHVHVRVPPTTSISHHLRRARSVQHH